MKDTLASLLALSGGDNHACVGNGDADTGDNLGKGVVVDSIGKGIRIDIIGIAKPWHADGVRTDAEGCF